MKTASLSHRRRLFLDNFIFSDGQMPCLCGRSTLSSHKPLIGPCNEGVGGWKRVHGSYLTGQWCDGTYRLQADSVIADFDFTAEIIFPPLDLRFLYRDNL
jgi:hypothetical protein